MVKQAVKPVSMLLIIYQGILILLETLFWMVLLQLVADPRGIPITNLSWILNRTMNVGIDIGLLNNKITGQFDIFERKRTGVPFPRYDVLLPSEVGYGLPNENLNEDATRGIEGIGNLY